MVGIWGDRGPIFSPVKENTLHVCASRTLPACNEEERENFPLWEDHPLPCHDPCGEGFAYILLFRVGQLKYLLAICSSSSIYILGYIKYLIF